MMSFKKIKLEKCYFGKASDKQRQGEEKGSKKWKLFFPKKTKPAISGNKS